MNDLIDALVPAGARVLKLFGVVHVARDGVRTAVPDSSKRLVAFVALHPVGVERRVAAGALWPEVDDERAAGNLRSCLWRLSRAGVDLIAPDPGMLRLVHGLAVDTELALGWAGRLIEGRATPADLRVRPGAAPSVDLLPGCYEDWALAERERVRQRLLRGMEVLSGELLRAGLPARAVDAALAVAAIDPLRETAQRLLVQAHLAEDNWAEGHRAFESYRHRLRTDLGVEPGPGLLALLSARRQVREAAPGRDVMQAAPLSAPSGR